MNEVVILWDISEQRELTDCDCDMSLAIENAKDNLATRLEDVPVTFWKESDCFMFSPKKLSKAKLKAMS